MSPAPRQPIRPLDLRTIERIAAGEVVERPASVVKELVENAVDAGAKEVRISLVGGGLTEIRVEDDGGGIPADELALAVERHATSKLSGSDELEVVTTLGFRGEALAAIAAVSRLRITSRIPRSDEAHSLAVEGSQAGSVEVAGRPPGTTVEVHDLFYNTPARRKFLRAPASEQVEISAVLQRLYLARPGVGLTLETEGGRVARYPPVSRLEDAVVWAFGEEFLGQSFRVEGPLPEGGRLSGVLGRPSLSRSASTSLHLSVNGRAILSRPLSQAVRVAFSGYLPKTRFPIGALTLVLPTARVDVNVHPTKKEVRFVDERGLGDALIARIRGALQEAPHTSEMRSPAARSTSAESPEPRTGISRGGPAPVIAGADRSARPKGAQRFLLAEGAPVPVTGSPRHPALRLLGCLFSLYWVAEGTDGLVLVDQHAASERVVFDALRRDGRLGRQELVSPITVALDPTERTALDAHAEVVRAAGFDVEDFGGGRVRVRAVPSYLGHRMAADAFRPMLDEIAHGGRATLPDALVDRVAASIACHAAVRAGDMIEATELSRILAQLYALPDAAYACPHGRPILVTWARGQLARQFLRSGD